MIQLFQSTTSPQTNQPSMQPRQASPWRTLGVSLNTSLDHPRLLEHAGLNWEPQREALHTQTGQLVPDHVVLQRDDTKALLGVVGKDYHPLANHELVRFLQNASTLSNAVVETAGAFQGGKTVWMQIRLPQLHHCMGADESHGYLLISNGHVGNRAVTITPTTIRVVCQNTLAMAEAHHKERGPSLSTGYKVRHTKRMALALKDIEQAYAQVLADYQLTKEANEYLARIPLTEHMKASYWEAIWALPDGPDESGRAATIRQKRLDTLEGILASDTCQVTGTKNTAYSLLQSVTEYVDHHRSTKGRNHVEQRLSSATFGEGARLKDRAWQEILNVAAA